jgi:hypothetical protein
VLLLYFVSARRSPLPANSHYLEYLGKVDPKLAAQSPALTNFATPSMVIEYGPKEDRKEFTHKFNPPMYAGQARKRLEEMHQEARKGLGLVSSMFRCSDAAQSVSEC